MNLKLLTLLAIIHQCNAESFTIHRRQLLQILYCLLTLKRVCGSIRVRNYLVTAVLGHPDSCFWQKLYAEAETHSKSFINVVSVDKASFEILLKEFSKHYTVLTGPGKRGRPPKVTEKSTILGLLLHFYTGTMESKTLCELFGIPPATLYRVLSNAELAFSKAMDAIPDCKIRWPSLEEQRLWSDLITRKEPLIQNKFGYVDGKNYKVLQPKAADQQNALYNGWLHATLITGVLCFGADGCIIWMKHNCPGSWNDSEMSRPFRDLLLNEKKTGKEYGVTADSAFPTSDDMFNKIVTPLKDGQLDRTPARNRAEVEALSNAITSIRQAAEWGMGSVPKVYRRLHLPLPFNPVVRGLRLRNIHRLYNFRVRRTGISQIRSVFFR